MAKVLMILYKIKCEKYRENGDFLLTNNAKNGIIIVYIGITIPFFIRKARIATREIRKGE